MKKSAAPLFAGAAFNFVLFIGHAAGDFMGYTTVMALVIAGMLYYGLTDLA